MPDVIFVDENDHVIGHGSHRQASLQGIVHRIARIFVFNSHGELLVQKRSVHVSVPNKWDQSAAGYVDEGEDYQTAALRELQEEVGITGVPLKEVTKFYTEETDEKATKKRFNMLYSTTYDGAITIDEHEVAAYKWLQLAELAQWLQEKPQDFTQGFIQTYQHFKQQSAQ